MVTFEIKAVKKPIQELKEGYKASAREDRKLSEEWDATVGGWNGLNGALKTIHLDIK